MVAIHEANGLGLGTAFEHGRAAEFQIFDEDDAIAIGKDIAVRVFHHARAVGDFGCSGARPFVTAGDAFPFIGKFQNVIHLAHRASRFAHKIQRNSFRRAGSSATSAPRGQRRTLMTVLRMSLALPASTPGAWPSSGKKMANCPALKWIGVHFGGLAKKTRSRSAT